VVGDLPDGPPWSGAGGSGKAPGPASGSHEGRRYALHIDGCRESRSLPVRRQPAQRLDGAVRLNADTALGREGCDGRRAAGLPCQDGAV
jgi:hypothetical protein